VSDTRNPALLRSVRELSDEIREGRWQHVAELCSKPPRASDELIAELRSRCPGFTRDEYEAAITGELLAPRLKPHRSPLSAWFYWAVAFTFIWALFITTVGLKKIGGVNEWISFFLYPAMCIAAALHVLRAKRNGGIVFALLNAACAIAWMTFVMWAARAFAGSFWK
jgi:hypothetical protein